MEKGMHTFFMTSSSSGSHFTFATKATKKVFLLSFYELRQKRENFIDGPLKKLSHKKLHPKYIYFTL